MNKASSALSNSVGKPAADVARLQKQELSNARGIHEYSMFASLIESGDYLIITKDDPVPASTDDYRVSSLKTIDVNGEKRRLLIAWELKDYPQQAALREMAKRVTGRQNIIAATEWNSLDLKTRQAKLDTHYAASRALHELGPRKRKSGKPWTQVELDLLGKYNAQKIYGGIRVDKQSLSARSR